MIKKGKYISGIRLFFIFFISFLITDSYCQLDNKAFYLPSSYQAEKDEKANATDSKSKKEHTETDIKNDK